MLTIVVPMAGAGRRFAEAGYPVPKPLIPIHGVPMVALVIKNLAPARKHRFVFICQRAHLREFDLRAQLRTWAPGSDIVDIDGLTEGAACTVLAARSCIDPDAPLMIANSDQYVDFPVDSYLAAADRPDLDGLIMTMRANHPKWSYVGLDADGFADRVVEKEVISNTATVGIYNYARGSDFIMAAERMIAEDCRVNGEFYVAPAYNFMIANGARVGIHDVGDVGTVMHGLGTPEDLEAFLPSDAARRATQAT